MYSAISHATILSAILGNTEELPGGRFHASFIFNIDAVSCLVGGVPGNMTVRMAEGSTAALRKLGRSPSATIQQGKERGIKQFYVTSPDGFLLVAKLLSRTTTSSLYHSTVSPSTLEAMSYGC
jgi:hypothetical protein